MMPSSEMVYSEFTPTAALQRIMALFQGSN
jgi:hypothetical protein